MSEAVTGHSIFSLEITDPSDVVSARSKAREIAAGLGLGSADQTRLATAISEITRNVIQYAGPGGGVCRLFDESDDEWIRIRIEVEDWGIGITDVVAALRDGYSTGGGLGAGLPGARRLMDQFDIQSRPGCTKVEMSMIRRRHHG